MTKYNEQAIIDLMKDGVPRTSREIVDALYPDAESYKLHHLRVDTTDTLNRLCKQGYVTKKPVNRNVVATNAIAKPNCIMNVATNEWTWITE